MKTTDLLIIGLSISLTIVAVSNFVTTVTTAKRIVALEQRVNIIEMRK